MAVELLIVNRRTKSRELVAVATSEVFRDYWKAGSKELGLRFVPLLEDGLFERGDIPDLLIELNRLKDWFQRTQSQQVSRGLIERVNKTIIALEGVLNHEDLTIG